MKVWVALAVLSVLLLYVWERVDVVQVGYQVEQLKVKKVALQRERDELRLRVSTLTAPERLARAAVEKLGMTAPHQGQVRLVRLDPDVPSASPVLSPEVQIARR
jgi:cell division protein FtsL